MFRRGFQLISSRAVATRSTAISNAVRSYVGPVRAATIPTANVFQSFVQSRWINSKDQSGFGDDFKAQSRDLHDTEWDELKSRLEQDVQAAPVVLYMKGVPQAPQCGFSSRVVQILAETGLKMKFFTSYNVLADEEIRQGIKRFSDWPTIPQLYINGEFIGGCDIVIQMHESGELQEMIDSAVKSAEAASESASAGNGVCVFQTPFFFAPKPKKTARRSASTRL